MGPKFFLTKISRAREASNKSRGINPDLFDSRAAPALGLMGAAAWWNTCGATNLSDRLMRGIVPKRVGERHGRLRVLREGPRQGRKTRWWCECDCGRACVLVRSDALGIATVSCGCIQKERSAEVCRKRATHNLSRTPAYLVWQAMKNRCYRTRDPYFFAYGGRGIRVCEAWRRSFEAFLQDMGPQPGRGYSIERVDNDGHYEPGNCVWATAKQQARNRRNTVWVQWNGETLALAEAAERAGVNHKRAYALMRRGQQFIRTEKPE